MRLATSLVPFECTGFAEMALFCDIATYCPIQDFNAGRVETGWPHLYIIAHPNLIVLHDRKWRDAVNWLSVFIRLSP
eukprot:6178153-Pleurochrysis_carterae.AAC.1